MVRRGGKTEPTNSDKTNHLWNLIGFAGTVGYFALNFVVFVSQNDNRFCLGNPLTTKT